MMQNFAYLCVAPAKQMCDKLVAVNEISGASRAQ